MTKPEAIAIVKAINRHSRRNYSYSIGDFATFNAVHPRLCAVFNDAAAVVAGRRGRYLPQVSRYNLKGTRI